MVMAEAAGKLNQLNETAAAISGILVGVGTALSGTKQTGLTNQIAALAKNLTGQSPIFTYPDAMTAVKGLFNSSTIGGIILIGIDYGIDTFIDGKHGYKYASPWVRDLGIGLFAGGIVKGVLDPATGARATPYSGPSIGGITTSRGFRQGQQLGFAGI